MLFVLNITKMYFSGQNPLKVTLSRKTITGTHAPYVMYEIQQVQTVSEVTLSRKTITGTHAPYVMYKIQQVQTVSEAERYVPALYFVVLRQC